MTPEDVAEANGWSLEELQREAVRTYVMLHELLAKVSKETGRTVSELAEMGAHCEIDLHEIFSRYPPDEG